LKKVLKRFGIALGVLALATAALLALGAWLGQRKMERTVQVKVVPVAFVKDAGSLQRGRYLFESRGCAQCHGADGAGRVFIDDPNGLYVKTPDITPGPGGVVHDYAEADWVRAVRHGVSPTGHALLIMPSEDYARMSDADFAALVAYARSLPPRAGAPARIRLPLLVKALYGAGVVRDAAEKIDHRSPPPPAIAPARTAAYGEYAAQMCVGCHRADLSGGPIPGAPPDWPTAANLGPGPGSVLPRYDTLAKFASMMRTGKRPDGSAVSPVMPFASLARLDDTDLAAIYAYLTSLGTAR